MTDRTSPETETLADKFERCDHAAFYFSDAKDEPMRREVLTGDEHDLIVAALRRSGLAPCLDLEPVAWRYRFVTSVDGDLSDWFIVDDIRSIPARINQTIQPLYITSPDSSTDRTCQKCGCTTKGEEAWVDGQIWCHPCADTSIVRGDK